MIKSRNFKYRAGSVLFIVIVAVILIVANLLVNQLSQRLPLKADLTANKLYKLSEYTENLVRNLDGEITIYAVYANAKENPNIQEILYRYQRLSDKITIVVVDSVRDPGFVNKYDKSGSGFENQTVIFEAGDRFKVVTPGEIYDFSYLTGTYNNLLAEQKYTAAIELITTDKLPKIVKVTGHDERDISDVDETLKNDNYEIESLSLLTTDIPLDTDILFILSPKRDFSAEEMEKVIKYLEDGGNLFVTFDLTSPKLDRFEAYLREWGITVPQEVVFEGNSKYILGGNPMIFTPQNAAHEITGNILNKGIAVVVSQSRPIDSTTIRGILSERIFTTTENGNVKSLLDEDSEPETKGMVTVGESYEKDLGDNEKARIVVWGSSLGINSQIFKEPTFGNMEVFLNTMAWLSDKSMNLGIRPKPLTSGLLRITNLQYSVFLGIVILIPVLVIIFGIIVWLRRRHL